MSVSTGGDDLCRLDDPADTVSEIIVLQVLVNLLMFRDVKFRIGCGHIVPP